MDTRVPQKPEPKTRRDGDNEAFGRIADFLRSETAQTLGYVAVQLAALAGVDELPVLHQRIVEVRGEVRDELRRILALVAELDAVS